MDEGAMNDISSIEQLFSESSAKGASRDSTIDSRTPGDDLRGQQELECSKGTQGPIDVEVLAHLAENALRGVEDAENNYHEKLLIEHMLKPFSHRREAIIPCYDAEHHLESYFPVLFPHGRGGPKSTGDRLGPWVAHALSVYQSRFATDMDFIFFVYSVLKRKRLTGLAKHAPIRDSASNAILEVKELLSSSLPSYSISKRIDKLLRSGTLSASFETLRGSPAFWATLKRTAWAYLTEFGPCQLFITISAADLIDLYLYCEAKPGLSLDAARNLTAKQRADILAENPVAATSIFHRRVQSLSDSFLFGNSRPFGEIDAFLGRIEQQDRHSPHLHLLIWLKSSLAVRGDSALSSHLVALFIEMLSTAKLPGDQLTDQDAVPPPEQHIIPTPTHRPSRRAGAESEGMMCSADRHEVLSRPINVDAFDGSVRSNQELRRQLLATQLHRCNNYCKGDQGDCRFLFPFPPQARASVARRNGTHSNPRYIALPPRTLPNLNSTHPLLTAMFHSNTDVTIVTGTGIPESMYVCSYAVKADKSPLVNSEVIRKVKRLGSGVDDRFLLGAIARHSSVVRTIGAQEAVDFLLNNPLTFCSAQVQNIHTGFLMAADGALSIEQKSEFYGSGRNPSNDDEENLLSQLDSDDRAAVPQVSKNFRRTTSGLPYCDKFISLYVRRPTSLEDLSCSLFHAEYEVRRIRRGQVNYDKEMMLRPPAPNQLQILSPSCAHAEHIVQKRKVLHSRPIVRNILNVPSRGVADEESPYFAAAALVLHVPFRSIDDLLAGRDLVGRLNALLETKSFPRLNAYVENSVSLSQAMARTPVLAEASSFSPQSTEAETEENGIMETDLGDDEMPSEHFNPMDGLLSAFYASKCAQPLSIEREWNGFAHFREGECEMQFDLFKSYVTECRTVGLFRANCNLLATEPEKENASCNDAPGSQAAFGLPNAGVDPLDVFSLKEKLIGASKTGDQRRWLTAVLSYLQVYYDPNPTLVPQSLKQTCALNRPIFTNAPGGCGKSWLLNQVSLFISHCIPFSSSPVWCQTSGDHDSADVDSGFEILPDDIPMGRLGRMAIFAPSGVAAGNSNGYTFHNGLRHRKITIQMLLDGPKAEVLAKLIKDFARVSVIVIEEYSMVALQLIAFLDIVCRKARPAFSHTFMGAIPTIITGDGLQLPVVGAKGILSDKMAVSPHLRAVYDQCSDEVFCLTLSESVRQESDRRFGDVLMRLRLAESTEDDVKLLNTRCVTDVSAMMKQTTSWCTAPILTAKNVCVNAFNNACIVEKGSQMGTFNIYSMPVASRRNNEKARHRSANAHFSTRRATSLVCGGSQFQPATVTTVYPGMPVMLRSNICPSLGLSNGSTGKVVAVVQNGFKLPPHESLEDCKRRYMNGNRDIPSLLVDFGGCYRGMVSAIRAVVEDTDDRNAGVVLLEPQNFENVRGLPIAPAHSMSMHRSQSLTLKRVLIDPRDVFCMGALYVSFSRAPSLDRIILIAPVTLEVLNKFKSQTLKVLARLQEIEENSMDINPFVSFVQEREVVLTSMLELGSC